MKNTTAAMPESIIDQVNELRAILTAIEELTGYLLSDDYPNDRPLEGTVFGLHLMFTDLNQRLTGIFETLESQAPGFHRAK